jgi:hypothetical protein
MLDYTLRFYFKNLASWIRKELPKVQYDEKIWRPFKYYGQFTELEAIAAIVENGTPPTIDVAFIEDYAEYYRKNRERNKDKIHLNRKLCREFNKKCKDSDVIAVQELPKLIMISTILHEIVHWGDERKVHRQNSVTNNWGIDELGERTQPDRDIITDSLDEMKNADVGFQFENEAFPTIIMDKLGKNFLS